MSDLIENVVHLILGVAVVYLVSWALAAVLLTATATYETCDSGAQYERGLEDWHMVGPWLIATDYRCGER